MKHSKEQVLEQVINVEHLHPVFDTDAQKLRTTQEIACKLREIFQNQSNSNAQN